MEPFNRRSAVLALVVFALVCSRGKAQQARTIPASPTPQPFTRQKASIPLPFSLGGERPEAAALISFSSSDQMSQPDRDLWAGSQAAVSQQANAAGLDFNQGTWDTHQIVCSALPDHLFLNFTRASGTDEASAFTASIPRGGGGPVRIIPILRRGYSPFSTAPVNALTISAFNHIRAEEHPAQPSDWLATGVCYAALAGARPEIGLAGNVNQRKDSTAAPGSLTITAGSGGEISFIDLNANSRRDLWTMSFDGSGRLLAVTLTKPPNARQRVKQVKSLEIQGKPVPQAAESLGKPVPQQKVALQGRLVPAADPVARKVPAQ
jgi:hypothetical protein